MRAALQHPLGITLLIASLLLAAAMRFLPFLELWSGRWIIILLLGVVAYIASVAAARFKKSEISAPELNKLYSLRKYMESRLSERDDSFGLAHILLDSIQQLDRQVIPALRHLLVRHREQSDLLERYESDRLPRPEPAVFERLKANVARQQAVIEECVQQASNAAVPFLEIIQENSDEDVATQAYKLASELSELYDIITNVMNDEDKPVEPEPASSVSAGNNEESLDDPADEEESTDGLRPHVEKALRQLNNLSALSQSGLINRLPCTVDAHDADTPLEQAQTLHEVLVSSIDMLKPANGDVRAGSAEAMHYNILHEQYVQGRPNGHIMTRHNLPDTTFYRHRRDAVSVVSRHLETQEELIASAKSSVNTPPLVL